MRITLSLLLLVAFSYTNLSAQIKNTLEDLDYTKKDPKNEIDYEEYILKNGFFLDGIIQHASIKISEPTSSYIFNPQGVGLGFRLGSKWYFGNMKTYRPGLSAVWGRVNILLASPSGQASIYPYIALAPANIGFCNAFSFGGKFGLEVNINFGLNFIVDIQYFDAVLGYLVNPNIKFRYKSFAVGLDVSVMVGDYISTNEQAFNTLIGLTIGGKF